MNSSEELVFRYATEDDVSYIVQTAYAQTNHYLEKAYNGVFDWARWENELRQDIYDQNYGNKVKNNSKINQFTHVMILELSNNIIGFIWFSYYSPEIIWLDSIILDSNNQNKGYGRQIINQLIENFREHFKHLDLGVQEENTDAIRFYTRLGFYQIEDLAMNYYLTKRMRKDLSS